MRHCRVLAFLLFACFHAPAQQATKEPDLPKPVDLVWAVKIPMRDGVPLNATVYRPHGQKEALRVIFELAPYISDSYHSRAYYFAQHGYVFAIVDGAAEAIRRGSSSHSFRNPTTAMTLWNGWRASPVFHDAAHPSRLELPVVQ
jgi:hypothetical protein